ncbi:MAG: hypothetical protein KKG75_01345 [Nanoarchaeota archaeon]|nr:hypothetical protein [Nanoarchaeota archaeon]
MGFFGKVTGMEYLDGNGSSKNTKSDKKESSSKKSAPTRDLSKHDKKLLKEMEQNLKKINNMVEDMLERVRVRRGY